MLAWILVWFGCWLVFGKEKGVLLEAFQSQRLCFRLFRAFNFGVLVQLWFLLLFWVLLIRRRHPPWSFLFKDPTRKRRNNQRD